MDKCVKVSKRNSSIVLDKDKCDNCGICSSICSFNVGVYGFSNESFPCINCGSCSLMCPKKCLSEKDETSILRDYLHSGKTIIFQVAPAARVSIGEEFGLEPGINMAGKLVSALRLIGGDYVFDTTFGADLTVMEEASELVDRINKKLKGPMFTSCCPAWVKFVEMFYPEYLGNLSTCKSPIAMEEAIIRNYFSKVNNIDNDDIISISIVPCTAKKMERVRFGPDLAITVRELAKYLKEEHIDIRKLKDSRFDNLMSTGSGGGLIFGTSGGVTESVMREVYHILNKKKPKGKVLNFKNVRGLSNIKEANIKIKGYTFRIAVINGTGDARKVLERIKKNEVNYDFIEVMACEGGCISGGGQPRVYDNTVNLKKKRMNALYNSDKKMKTRYASDNPDIKRVYKELLGSPLSEKAKELLHTTYGGDEFYGR